MIREAHVIDGPAANMLVGIDIIAPEKMVINVANECMIMNACHGAKVPIVVRAKQSKCVFLE